MFKKEGGNCLNLQFNTHCGECHWDTRILLTGIGVGIPQPAFGPSSHIQDVLLLFGIASFLLELFVKRFSVSTDISEYRKKT